MNSHVPTNKLPDTVAACNIIKFYRAKNKERYLCKSISVSIKEFDVFARLNLHFDKHTGAVSLSHCLRYQNVYFYPTTNQKLRCTNQHALDVLEERRAWRSIRRKKITGGFKR